jgi:hypothetical protein
VRRAAFARTARSACCAHFVLMAASRIRIVTHRPCGWRAFPRAMAVALLAAAAMRAAAQPAFASAC